MNREFKFRAWDKETKEMNYDFLSKNWLRVCIQSPFVELMQYTGVKSFRSEKEIYESDIVKGYLGHPSCDFIAIVVFEEGMFKLSFIKPYGLEPKQITYHNACEIEVIGNIYETPELINV